jgi:hypothetical protein
MRRNKFLVMFSFNTALICRLQNKTTWQVRAYCDYFGFKNSVFYIFEGDRQGKLAVRIFRRGLQRRVICGI